MTAATNFQIASRNHLDEELRDSVSGDLMTRAVTLVPCGHVFNEDTVTEIVARSLGCPLDRLAIEKHVPNYTIRALANRFSKEATEPPEEVITEEAQRYFIKGKELLNGGDKEAAIQDFLKALQLCPLYEKAHVYLESSLGIFSRKNLPNIPVTPPNESYSDLLIRLLDNPVIQQDTALLHILESQLEALMMREDPTLTPAEQQTFRWIQKLLVDEKVSQFVLKKLKALPLSAVPSQLPAAALPKELKEFIRAHAFGQYGWMERFGGIGIEPLPPVDMQDILSAPCPFWPGKIVEETHMFVLIPESVGGEPLTLHTLGELIQKPRIGNPTCYEELNLGVYSDTPTPRSHWALITCEPIPGTEGKSYEDQQAVLAGYSKNAQIPYNVSTILDTTVSIFMSNLSKPNRCSPSYSRCKESYGSREQVCIVVLRDGSLSIGRGNPRLVAPKPFIPTPNPVPVFVPIPFETVCDPVLQANYEKACQAISWDESKVSHAQGNRWETRSVQVWNAGIAAVERAEESLAGTKKYYQQLLDSYHSLKSSHEEVRKHEHDKLVREHDTQEKAKETEYLAQQKDYEADQKAYATMGIRAQRKL